MTISKLSNKSPVYAINGTNSQVVQYSFLFLALSAAHIRVYIKNAAGVVTQLVLNSDYTVPLSSLNNESGGVIEFAIGKVPATAVKMQIYRIIPLLQETNLSNSGAWYPKTHEDVFDYLTMQNQQQQEEIDRSLKMEIMSAETPAEFMGNINAIRTAAETANTAAANALLAAQTAQESADNAVELADAALVTTGQNLAATLTAKNDAVSAKVAAENAQTAAETARGTATGAASAAKTAKDDALTAKQAAETAQGLTVSAAGAAVSAANLAEGYAQQASAISGVPLSASSDDILAGTNTDILWENGEGLPDHPDGTVKTRAKYVGCKTLKDAGIVPQEPADWNAATGKTKIENKPLTFPPAAHNHALNDLSEKSYSSLTDKPTIPPASPLTQTANADGFSIGGGTIPRTVEFTGGNMKFVGGGVSQYFVKLASDVTCTSVTITNAAGLSAPLEAGKTYFFKFRVRYTTVIYTTGIFLSANGPAFVPRSLSIDTLLPSTNIANMAPNHAGAWDAGVVSTGAGTGAGDNGRMFYAEVLGTVTTTEAGVLILRFRSEVAASGVTIKAGSLLELVKVD